MKSMIHELPGNHKIVASKTVAKYPVIAMIAVMLSASGCSGILDDGDYEAYLQQEELLAVQDSMEMAFAQTLNEIDQNLDMIREKEGVLVLGPESNAETGITTAEHIQRNISFINTLMDENREKLEKLSGQLKKANNKNALLTKLTDGIKERITKQEGEIAQLKTQLVDKSFEVAELNVKMNAAEMTNTMLKEKAEKFEKEASSAYYAVGSYTELKQENVLTKEGGVLGIGRKKVLKQDFSKDYFTEVNAHNTRYIPVFAQKAKLVTFHPKNSFELTKENDRITFLEITDPDEFWKASKVLVVEVQI